MDWMCWWLWRELPLIWGIKRSYLCHRHCADRAIWFIVSFPPYHLILSCVKILCFIDTENVAHLKQFKKWTDWRTYGLELADSWWVQMVTDKKAWIGTWSAQDGEPKQTDKGTNAKPRVPRFPRHRVKFICNNQSAWCHLRWALLIEMTFQP